MRQRLTGGDLAETWRVDDRVEKTYRQEGLAETEAAGLTWLTGGPPVPTVHESSAHRLVIQHVPEGSASRQGAEDFGRALARLHQLPATWGESPRGRAFVGTVEVSVGEHASWRACGEHGPRRCWRGSRRPTRVRTNGRSSHRHRTARVACTATSGRATSSGTSPAPGG